MYLYSIHIHVRIHTHIYTHINIYIYTCCHSVFDSCFTKFFFFYYYYYYYLTRYQNLTFVFSPHDLICLLR